MADGGLVCKPLKEEVIWQVIKWANIKHRKSKVDERRGKIFTKIGRELMVAVKEAGPDLKQIPPEGSYSKGQKCQYANETIMRNIQKLPAVWMRSIMKKLYTRLWPGGVAILLIL